MKYCGDQDGSKRRNILLAKILQTKDKDEVDEECQTTMITER
jgi:hypothetical protein